MPSTVAVKHTIVFTGLSLRYIELGDDDARPLEVADALGAPLTLTVHCRDAQLSTGPSRTTIVENPGNKELRATWGDRIELECTLTRSKRTGVFSSKDVRLVVCAQAGITGFRVQVVCDVEIDLVNYVAKRSLAPRCVATAQPAPSCRPHSLPTCPPCCRETNVELSMQPVLAASHHVKTTVALLSANIRCKPTETVVSVSIAPASAPARRASLLSPRHRSSLLPPLQPAQSRDSLVAPRRLLTAGVGRVVSAASDSSRDASGGGSARGGGTFANSTSSSCHSSFAATASGAEPLSMTGVTAAEPPRRSVSALEKQLEVAFAASAADDACVTVETRAQDLAAAATELAPSAEPAPGANAAAARNHRDVLADGEPDPLPGPCERGGGTVPSPRCGKVGALRRGSVQRRPRVIINSEFPHSGSSDLPRSNLCSGGSSRSSSSSSSSNDAGADCGGGGDDDDSRSATAGTALPSFRSVRQNRKLKRCRAPSSTADGDLGAIICRLLTREASMAPATRRSSLLSRPQRASMRSARTLSADDSFISHDALEWERVQYRDDQKRYGRLSQQQRRQLQSVVMSDQYSEDDSCDVGRLGSRDYSVGSCRPRSGSSGSALFAFETIHIPDGAFDNFAQWAAVVPAFQPPQSAMGSTTMVSKLDGVCGKVLADEEPLLAMQGAYPCAATGAASSAAGPAMSVLCPLADYFAVIGNTEHCGFGGAENGFDAHVLQCWPSSTEPTVSDSAMLAPPYELPGGLAQLCLPQSRFGALLQKDAPSPATFHFNIRLSRGTAATAREESEGAAGTVVFVACLVFYEQLCEVRCLDSEESQFLFVPKCFCLLSQWPCCSMLEAYLLELYLSASACVDVQACGEPVFEASSRGNSKFGSRRHMQKQMCASLRAFVQLELPIPFIRRQGVSSVCDAIELSITVGSERLLHLCLPPTTPFHVAVPTSGLAAGAPSVQQLAAHLVDDGVGVNAHALLGQLSTARILTVLAAALMGRQLVFISNDVSVLTDAVETLRALLRPLDIDDIVCIPYFPGPSKGTVESPWSLLPKRMPCLIGVVADMVDLHEGCIAQGMLPQSEHRRLQRWDQRMRKLTHALGLTTRRTQLFVGKGGCELFRANCDDEEKHGEADIAIFRAMRARAWAPSGGYAVLLDHDQLVSGDLAQLLDTTHSSVPLTREIVQTTISKLATCLCLPCDPAKRLEASLTRTKRRYCSCLGPVEQLHEKPAATSASAAAAASARDATCRRGVSFHECNADGDFDVQRNAVDREPPARHRVSVVMPQNRNGLQHDALLLAESCMVVCNFFCEVFGTYRRYFVHNSGLRDDSEAAFVPDFDHIAFAADGMCVNPLSMSELWFASSFVRSKLFLSFLERARGVLGTCALRDRADCVARYVASLHDHAVSSSCTCTLRVSREVSPPLPAPVTDCGLGSFVMVGLDGEYDHNATGWPILPFEELSINMASDDSDSGGESQGGAAAASAASGSACEQRGKPIFFSEEIFENERFVPVSGWGAARLPGDPGRWSMLARDPTGMGRVRACFVSFGSRDEAFQCVRLPSREWTWVDAWHVDTETARETSASGGSLVRRRSSTSASADFRGDAAEGWVYGSFFSRLERPRLLSASQRTVERPLDVVRRRKWVRTRCKRTTQKKGPQPRVIDRQFVQSVAEARGQRVASVSFGRHGALSFDVDRRSVSKTSSFFDSAPLVERDMVRGVPCDTPVPPRCCALLDTDASVLLCSPVSPFDRMLSRWTARGFSGGFWRLHLQTFS